MALASIKGTTTIGGLRVPEDVTVTAELVVMAQKVAAYATTLAWGQLTTRTSASVGTLTYSATPPVTTGQVVDLYFSGGIRYGVTIGTVTSTTAPFSGGTGSDLPAVTTSYCLPRVPVVESFVFSQDTAAMIIFAAASNEASDSTTVSYGTGRITVRLLTSGDAEIMRRTLEDGYSYRWTSGSGTTDPTAGSAVAKVSISHSYGAGVTAQKTVIAGVAYN
jgi:hypothetical protein